jgi:DNA-binding LacI/PurR family transcriptional regulator
VTRGRSGGARSARGAGAGRRGAAAAGRAAAAESGRAGADLLVVTNNRTRVFQRSIIEGAGEIAEARGYHVDVLEVPRPTAADEALEALERPPAGVLLVADVLPDAAVHELVRRGVTLTLVSHRVAELEPPAIMHDNAQGIALLSAHLLDACGRRKPVFLRGSERQLDAGQRERAWRRELMRRSLPIEEARFLRGDFEPATARASLAAYLDGGGALDALVAADYPMAIAAMDLLRERGLRVPEDVAVAGFGDASEAQKASLTCVGADVVELGRRAARQLVGQVEGLEIRGLTLLSTALVQRRSTAP